LQKTRIFTQDRLQALADDTHRRTASAQRDSLRSSFQSVDEFEIEA